MRHALFAAALLMVAAPCQARAAEQAVFVTDGGAKCDGSSDDTAAINSLLAQFKAGGLVRIPAGRLCLINSGDLNIPDNVIVAGDAAPGQRRSDSPVGSGFLLNPAYTIVMHGNSILQDAVVLRTGLVRDPTDAEVIEAVAAWGKEASHAITLAGTGVRLQRLFIEGFNTAIYSFGWGTFIFSDIVGDDYNGIFITGAGDNMTIADARFEPFYAIQSRKAHSGVHTEPGHGSGDRFRFDAEAMKQVQPGDFAAVLSGPHAGIIPHGTKVVSVDPKSGEVTLDDHSPGALSDGDAVNFGGSWARPGVAFYFQGNNGNTTGWYCQRCFSFMYRHGAVVDGTGIGTFTDADFEYQHAFDPEADGAGTFGLRLTGGSAAVSVNHSNLAGQSIELADDMAPPHFLQLNDISLGHPDFIITNRTTGPKAEAGMWFSGRTGEPVVVKLAGSPQAGAEQALTVNGRTFVFAPKQGAAGRVLSDWGRAVNSDPALAAQHVVALWAHDSLTIYAPPSVPLTVTPHATQPLTATLGRGRPSPGAWASVNGFIYNGPARVPAVVVAPNDERPVTFSGFSGDISGNISADAFRIDPSSTKVQFLTWSAGVAGNGALSACGRDPSLTPGSTALRGTIREGAGANGCTFTFPAAFPRAPVCALSSPSGSPIAGYAVTPQALTIRNAGGNGNQYSFICSP